MNLAKKLLAKYVWKEGDGLGRDRPLKADDKFDNAGLGHNLADDLNNHWWENVYNQAATNLNVGTNDATEVKMGLNNDQSVEITPKNYSVESSRKNSDCGKFKRIEQQEQELIDKLMRSSTIEDSSQVFNDYADCKSRHSKKNLTRLNEKKQKKSRKSDRPEIVTSANISPVPCKTDTNETMAERGVQKSKTSKASDDDDQQSSRVRNKSCKQKILSIEKPPDKQSKRKHKKKLKLLAKKMRVPDSREEFLKKMAIEELPIAFESTKMSKGNRRNSDPDYDDVSLHSYRSNEDDSQSDNNDNQEQHPTTDAVYPAVRRISSQEIAGLQAVLTIVRAILPIPSVGTVTDCTAVHNKSYENINIFVTTPNGRTISIRIGPFDAVLTLKMMIQEKEGIRSQFQRLVFGGRQMKDEQKVIDYNIEQYSTIHLLLRLLGGTIVDIVDSEGVTHKLDVEPTLPIASLKQTIEIASPKHPRHRQILKYNRCILQDDLQLQNYVIEDTAKIYLELAPEINICIMDTDGRTTEIATSLNATVEELRNQIFLRTNIPPDQQSLHLNGNSLPNNKSKLCKVGIFDGATIVCKQQFQPSIWQQIKAIPQNWLPFSPYKVLVRCFSQLQKLYRSENRNYNEYRQCI